MQKKDVDFILSGMIIAMLFFGVVMISSVSIYPSYLLTMKAVNAGRLAEPNTYHFMFSSIVYMCLGIAAMTIFSKIPYTFIEKNANRIFWASFFFLLLVFVPGIGLTLYGARGWIDIPFLPSIQPVEFAKLGLIVMLAFFLKKRRAVMRDFSMGFIAFFFYVGLILGLLIFQPDFGSILILAPVSLALFYVGGGNVRYIAIACGIALLGAISVYTIGNWQKSAYQERLASQQVVSSSSGGINLAYISTRIDNFFRDNKDIAKTKDQKGTDHQLRNAFIALGSGGFFGLGFGQSIQKFGYLPEVHGDFIFAVMVEELGFVGGLGIIGMYLFVAYRGYMISRGVKDLFGKYLAFGITTLFVVQAFINIGVNLNVVPLTGVTLPLMSAGGSSILSLTIAMGMLLSISRHVEVKPHNLSDALQTGRKMIF